MARHDDDRERAQIDQDAPVYLPAVPRSGGGSRGGWTYTEALGQAIADLYVDADSGGLWAVQAAAPDKIPPPTVLHAWKRQYPAFGLMMRDAERVRAERLMEQTIVIADTAAGSPARLALQIDTRTRLAERLDRARFGNAAGTGAPPPLLARDAQPVAVELTDDVLASIAAAGAGEAGQT
jgi:hypothetical protein